MCTPRSHSSWSSWWSRSLQSAYGGGAAWLVCELKFINAKRDTKQEKNDPVKKFENKTAHSNWSVVLAILNATELVFDEGDKCCQQEKECYFAMNEKVLDDCREEQEKIIRSILDAVWAETKGRVWLAIFQIVSGFFDNVRGNFVDIMDTKDVHLNVHSVAQIDMFFSVIDRVVQTFIDTFEIFTDTYFNKCI